MVGNCEVKLGKPRGFAVDVSDVIAVEITFGEETAAFEAILLKNESYPVW